jgi:hypothetical protein
LHTEKGLYQHIKIVNITKVNIPQLYLEVIVTTPSHQDEENFQVTLKKRMNHCLDHHTCKNKLRSLALPTIAQTKGVNGFRNLEHEHYISHMCVCVCGHARVIALKAQQCEAQISSQQFIEK